MSAHKEEVTGEVEVDATECKEQNSVKFSPDLVDERIKASLEPLHAQISPLPEMMDRLIQNNSARETTTVSTREIRYQYETLFNGAPGDSRFPTVHHLPPRDTRPTRLLVNVPEFSCRILNSAYFSNTATKPHVESELKRVFPQSIITASFRLSKVG